MQCTWNNFKKETKRLCHVLRWKTPTGTLLLFFPGFWGCILTHHKTWLVDACFVFCVALWSRSMGCFCNDWADRSLDQWVNRTKNRPLVAQPPSWIMMLWIVFFASFPIFFLSFFYSNALCVLIILGIILFALYPWCKRWTFYPQFFLSISFNLIIFFVPVFRQLDIHASVIVMYIWSVLWTFFYDTVYAFQDIKDDQKYGIKSVSVLWGPIKTRRILQRLFYLRYTIAFLIATSFLSTLILIGIMAYAFFLWKKTSLQCPRSCGLFFKKTLSEGVLISIWLFFFL